MKLENLQLEEPRIDGTRSYKNDLEFDFLAWHLCIVSKHPKIFSSWLKAVMTFDFKLTHQLMMQKDWSWGEGVPSVNDMVKRTFDLLVLGLEEKESNFQPSNQHSCHTGGFAVKISKTNDEYEVKIHHDTLDLIYKRPNWLDEKNLMFN